MVISDINILCVGQNKIEKYEFSRLSVDAYSMSNCQRERIYADRYAELQKQHGVWYQIYPKAREDANYGKEFMDLFVVGTDYCSGSNYRIVFLDKKIKKQLKCVIEGLYNKSPKRTICFVADLQGYEESNKYVSLEHFIMLFEKEELTFNTIYYIS